MSIDVRAVIQQNTEAMLELVRYLEATQAEVAALKRLLVETGQERDNLRIKHESAIATIKSQRAELDAVVANMETMRSDHGNRVQSLSHRLEGATHHLLALERGENVAGKFLVDVTPSMLRTGFTASNCVLIPNSIWHLLIDLCGTNDDVSITKLLQRLVSNMEPKPIPEPDDSQHILDKLLSGHDVLIGDNEYRLVKVRTWTSVHDTIDELHAEVATLTQERDIALDSLSEAPLAVIAENRRLKDQVATQTTEVLARLDQADSDSKGSDYGELSIEAVEARMRGRSVNPGEPNLILESHIAFLKQQCDQYQAIALAETQHSLRFVERMDELKAEVESLKARPTTVNSMGSRHLVQLLHGDTLRLNGGERRLILESDWEAMTRDYDRLSRLADGEVVNLLAGRFSGNYILAEVPLPEGPIGNAIVHGAIAHASDTTLECPLCSK